jgi:hypothetical protein
VLFDRIYVVFVRCGKGEIYESSAGEKRFVYVNERWVSGDLRVLSQLGDFRGSRIVKRVILYLLIHTLSLLLFVQNEVADCFVCTICFRKTKERHLSASIARGYVVTRARVDQRHQTYIFFR